MTEKIWTREEFVKLPEEQKNGCFKFDVGKIWYKDGKIHRDGGPAVEQTNGIIEWRLKGEWHRLDGPAIEDGSFRLYFIEGKQYSEEEFKIKAFVILHGLEKFL